MSSIETDLTNSEILIIDNELSILHSLSTMLVEKGCGIRGAKDVPTALKIINTRPPDLILLDAKIAVMHGQEISKTIKANENTKEIPVIFIRTIDETIGKVDGFEDGGADHITKPIQVEEVLARIGTHISLSRLRGKLNRLSYQHKNEINESKEQYQAIINASPIGILAIQNGLITMANPEISRMLGFSDPEEMIGRPSLVLVAPESEQQVTERLKRIEKGKDNPSSDLVLVKRDGTKITVESTSVSIFLQGEHTGIIIAKDVTERKRALELLVRNETKYRTLVENAPNGIFQVDGGNGQFLDCNSQALSMFGYTREEMLSFTPVDFSPPLAPDGRPVPEVLKERLESLVAGEQIMFEWVHLHADGREIPCEIRAVLLPRKDRRLLQVSMIDITERKKAEQNLEERLAFQQLILGISTQFIGLSGIEFEQSIHNTLGDIGTFFDVDTVRLYRLSLQGDVLKIRNMWRSPDLEPPQEMPEIHKMKYPNLATHYAKGETVVFGCIDECPQLPDLQKILKFFGTKAGIGVPLEVDDSGVDIFAMDKVQSEHIWPEDIITQSEVVGKVILSAMLRSEAEIKLYDHHKKVEELKKRLKNENIYLREEIDLKYRHEQIVGESPQVKNMLALAEQVACESASVLILGDTGTGKELLAHSIHQMSPRRKRAMVKVNCAALPATLIESELFGREKGAFTGALSRQIGRFEAADGSTIFLDEIGDLPLELQTKLLRVLQEGQFERLGQTDTTTVDVRVIAAANQDLAAAVKMGRFRRDLYYRLNVFPITVPPLRSRRDDIPLLVWTFINEFSQSMGKKIEKIPQKTMDMLLHYRWPGNIRELKNIIERAMIVSTKSTLIVEKLEMDESSSQEGVTMEEIERNHIQSVLASTGWRIRGKGGAAAILDMKPTTLDYRIKKLGIQRRPPT
jgi:formate hydrogenlyase transcriptional activator